MSTNNVGHLLQNIIKREKMCGGVYFWLFWDHWLRSEPQKGQKPLGLRSWFPQFGQKASFGCVASGLREGAAAVSLVGDVVFGLSFARGWDIF
jgi:hypothetical protein